MSQHTDQDSEYVVCVDNSGYPASLELHMIYRALPDDDARADGVLRIVDESGEDYLYSAHRFAAIGLPLAVKKSIEAKAENGLRAAF